jgi:hypothetical protein
MGFTKGSRAGYSPVTSGPPADSHSTTRFTYTVGSCVTSILRAPLNKQPEWNTPVCQLLSTGMPHACYMSHLYLSILGHHKIAIFCDGPQCSLVDGRQRSVGNLLIHPEDGNSKLLLNVLCLRNWTAAHSIAARAWIVSIAVTCWVRVSAELRLYRFLPNPCQFMCCTQKRCGSTACR